MEKEVDQYLLTSFFVKVIMWITIMMILLNSAAANICFSMNVHMHRMFQLFVTVRHFFFFKLFLKLYFSNGL